MKKPTIAILDHQDILVALTDKYFDSNLHTFLQGTSAFFTCSIIQTMDIAEHFKVGNKISFVYNGVSYHFDITSMKKNEEIVTIQADSLTLELRNEDAKAYKATKAMSFEEYLNIFLFKGDSPLVMGINEVSSKRITHEWTGDGDSVLSRLFSLANVFNAEIEFVTVLNDHWGLDKVVLNVYKEHDDNNQGIGKWRNDVLLEYGKNVDTIEYEENIDELKTGIRPVGTDNLKIVNHVVDVKDDDGNQLFSSPKGDDIIRAVQARNQFMSKIGSSDGYIIKNWSYETKEVAMLAGQALAELKKLCIPKVTVTIKGFANLNIGDTVRVQNRAYKPHLNLTARVSEQSIFFEKPENNETTYTNIEILKSEIDQSLIDRVNKIIEENKQYQCMISTDNGIQFVNSKGSTQLIAKVMDGIVDLADSFTIKWMKDGVFLAEGKIITVKATDVNEKAVYRFEAIDGNGDVRGSYEATVTNVNDGKEGKEGEQGEKGEDGKTSYVHQAWANSAPSHIKDINLIDTVSVEDGYYLDENGIRMSDPLWSNTDYIDVHAYDSLYVEPNSVSNFGNAPSTILYDKNKEMVGAVRNFTNFTSRYISLNPNVYYVRYSLEKKDKATIKIHGKLKQFTTRYPQNNFIDIVTNGSGGSGNTVSRGEGLRSVTLKTVNQNRPGVLFDPTGKLVDGKKYTMSFKFVWNNGDAPIGIGGHCICLPDNVKYFNGQKIGGSWGSNAPIPNLIKNVPVEIVVIGTYKKVTGDNNNIYIQPNRLLNDIITAEYTIYDWKIEEYIKDDQHTPFVPHISNPSYSDYMPMRYTGWITNFEEEAPQDPSEYVWQKVLGPQGPPGEPGKDGANGKDGENGKNAPEPISGYLSNEIIGIPANSQGTVTDFSKATGQFIVYEGQTKVSSGVAYSITSQTGVTATVNAQTGEYKVTASTSDSGTVFMKAVYKGVTIEKILNVVKVKVGPDGKPTGIVVSNTIPSSPYVGMLWQCTGNIAGYIKDALYRYTGSSWVKHTFTADNISAGSLSAISADLGMVTAGVLKGVVIEGSRFINPYQTNAQSEGVNAVLEGQIELKEAIIKNSYTLPATGEKGTVIISPLTYSTKVFDKNNNLVSMSALSTSDLYLNDGTSQGSLTAKDLVTTSWQTLPLSNGTGKVMIKRTIGGVVTIRFDNYYFNGTGLVTRLPDVFWCKRSIMFIVAGWSGDGVGDKFQLNGTDNELKKITNLHKANGAKFNSEITYIM